MSLESIEVIHGDSPNASIIWLHGLGADGHDFEGLIPQLQLPAELSIRFIFPHAPFRPISLNNGYEMRGWYDIYSLEIGSEQDEAGIRQSAAELEALIEQEIQRGIDPGRIILAGFSQGGAIALHTGLRYPRKLAGILALSTYIPLGDTLADEISPAGREIAVFMAHGRQDDILSFEIAQLSRERLSPLNPNIEWHEYDMAHSLCMEELIHIRQWLLTRLES